MLLPAQHRAYHPSPMGVDWCLALKGAVAGRRHGHRSPGCDTGLPASDDLQAGRDAVGNPVAGIGAGGSARYSNLLVARTGPSSFAVAHSAVDYGCCCYLG